MGSNYLISRRWALTSRFVIADESGGPQFEVRGRFALGAKLSVCDGTGTEVAVIARRGMGRRYQILAGGQETTVSARGFLGTRYDIDSPDGPLEARGNFSGRQYSITRGGVPAAAVTQLRTLREQFAVQVTPGEDAVLMLAVVLVIEAIRDARRRAAAASG
ncbi:MAG TPA: hypothetical protein VKU77_04810 [Streptosporangiaceae bacterium]|nr:hypothetical protein [Streptosporangiaceae bacterium]